MATLDELFDTNVLIHVVNDLISQPSTWLLDRYFPNMAQSDTQYVSIDVDLGLRRMTPFSLPTVQAPLVENRHVNTVTLQPAYLKDKRAIDPYRPVRRMIGERIGGEASAIDRVAQNIAETLANQLDNLNRRMEWMAASGLVNGSITIAGDSVPSQTLDFQRDSALSVTLVGNYLWDSGNTAAVPTDNLQNWATIMLKHSGVYPTDVILTTTPWEYLRKNSAFKDAFSYPRTTTSGADGNYRAGNSVEFGAEGGRGGIYLGKWGQFNLYLYNEWYLDSSNVEQQMITDGTVIMASPQLEGIRAFGAIIDPSANYRAMPYFPKSWVSHDPAQRFIMLQSAPLVYPSRVNACFAATVTAANTDL